MRHCLRVLSLVLFCSAGLDAFGFAGLFGEVGRPWCIAEAARFGLASVVAPEGAGSGALPAPSLRDALRAALPGPQRAAA